MPLKKTCIFLGLWLIVYNQALSQAATQNLSLVSQFNYTERLNDIWGYVDDAGSEYALVGLRNGVSIVDLSDPSNPEERDFLPGVRSAWRDLKTHDNYAYISNETGDGIRIIDLSTLPGQVNYKDTTLAGINTAHNLYVDEGFLYVTGTDNFNGGIVIFDLNQDPWNPVFRGAYTLRYVHDVYVRNNIAYAAEISDRRLSIVDVSDKTIPQLIGQTAYQGAFTHNTWLNDASDVVFTTDEYAGAYVRAWDVSDPGKIEELDRIRSSLSGGAAAPHNVHVRNDYLVTSYYRDGIHISDASRPNNLIEVGYYDTSEALANGGFNGNWGAYPFFPSGLIIASDIENGLFVLSPTYVRGCYLEGTVRDLVSGIELEEVEIEIIGEEIQDRSQDDGSYATGIGQSGTYQVAFSKFGYESDTIIVALSNGALTIRDVDLISLNRINLTVEVRERESGNLIPEAKILAIANGSQTKFNYLTDPNGLLLEPGLVINPYQLIVGKWGYVTQEAFIEPSANDTSITFFLEKGFYDDFSLDFGWETASTASKGDWEIAEPDGTYRNGNIYAPEFDLDTDIGEQAFVTDNQDDGAFGYDVDRGYVLLSSPWMDLSEYNEPVINYHYWFVNWSLRQGTRNQPGNDFLAASITDGIDTIEIKRYTGPFDTTWTEESRFFFQKYFDLQTTPVKFLLYTQDFEDDNQDAVEAGLDGFRVVESNATPIDPDLPTISFIIFPNPVNERLFIDISDIQAGERRELSFEIRDIQGRKIFEQKLNEGREEYQIEFPWASGLYLAQILKNGRRVASKKILK
ncbi:MAG: choice-of-anchor B family protein [Bacteroidota bacterium]